MVHLQNAVFFYLTLGIHSCSAGEAWLWKILAENRRFDGLSIHCAQSLLSI